MQQQLRDDHRHRARRQDLLHSGAARHALLPAGGLRRSVGGPGHNDGAERRHRPGPAHDIAAEVHPLVGRGALRLLRGEAPVRGAPDGHERRGRRAQRGAGGGGDVAEGRRQQGREGGGVQGSDAHIRRRVGRPLADRDHRTRGRKGPPGRDTRRRLRPLPLHGPGGPGRPHAGGPHLGAGRRPVRRAALPRLRGARPRVRPGRVSRRPARRPGGSRRPRVCRARSSLPSPRGGRGLLGLPGARCPKSKPES
mmetsp:Transcript_121788/g.345204  ORF Transcript_121788/g.345204 Transcript_121788/m.345204 type:complete len:252 (-) Transcript_121788:6-761(-)